MIPGLAFGVSQNTGFLGYVGVLRGSGGPYQGFCGYLEEPDIGVRVGGYGNSPRWVFLKMILTQSFKDHKSTSHPYVTLVSLSAPHPTLRNWGFMMII